MYNLYIYTYITHIGNDRDKREAYRSIAHISAPPCLPMIACLNDFQPRHNLLGLSSLRWKAHTHICRGNQGQLWYITKPSQPGCGTIRDQMRAREEFQGTPFPDYSKYFPITGRRTMMNRNILWQIDMWWYMEICIPWNLKTQRLSMIVYEWTWMILNDSLGLLWNVLMYDGRYSAIFTTCDLNTM